jgi:hypothetical protein
MNMKTSLQTIALALLIGGQTVGLAQNDITNDPAYLPIDSVLDLKIARPEVNINLPRFLLRDALSEFDGGTNDPLAAAGISFADLTKDIKLIRVIVIEAEDENKSHIDKAVKSLRKELETKWTTIVSVPEDNVGIYAVSDPEGEKVAGIAVLVQDDEDVVIANVVGRVSIGKIVKIASQVKVIPPEVLQKLSGFSAKGGDNSGAEDGKTKKEGQKEKAIKTEKTSE